MTMMKENINIVFFSQYRFKYCRRSDCGEAFFYGLNKTESDLVPSTNNSFRTPACFLSRRSHYSQNTPDLQRLEGMSYRRAPQVPETIFVCVAL